MIKGANLNFSRSSLGYCHFQIGCVFADLFKTQNPIPNFTYISFGIILTQFYINFLRQEHQIERLQVSTDSSGFSLYLSFFSFTVPLRNCGFVVASLWLRCNRKFKNRVLFEQVKKPLKSFSCLNCSLIVLNLEHFPKETEFLPQTLIF